VDFRKETVISLKKGAKLSMRKENAFFGEHGISERKQKEREL
jgi:hypothetical protein